MKICANCGAYNSDERFFCVDCDEKLGDSLSTAEEQRLDDRIDDSLEAMYNRRDPLYVSKLDKVLGTVSLVGAAVSLVLLLIGAITRRNFSLLWAGVLFFLIAGVDALFPQVAWFFERLRLNFHIRGADDVEPSGFYRICRRVGVVLGTVVGIVVLTVCLLDFRHPPVRKYISQIAATESAGIYSHAQPYIEANPEKWQKILDAEDYAVGVFINALQDAPGTGLEEVLMMQAIVEITGRKDLPLANKDLFVLSYNSTFTGGQEYEYED